VYILVAGFNELWAVVNTQTLFSVFSGFHRASLQLLLLAN